MPGVEEALRDRFPPFGGGGRFRFEKAALLRSAVIIDYI